MPPPPRSSGSRAARASSTHPAPLAVEEEIRSGLLSSGAKQDIRIGRSSWGPHLDELKLDAGGRSLRRYGSQGQQRAALLALLFAEREVLLAARRVTPLLLLDDVMSELDPGRRERLVGRLDDGGQALITAADEESLPAAGAALGGADAPPAGGGERGGGMTPPPRPAPGVRGDFAPPATWPRRRPAWRRLRQPGPARWASSWRPSPSLSRSGPER